MIGFAHRCTEDPWYVAVPDFVSPPGDNHRPVRLVGAKVGGLHVNFADKRVIDILQVGTHVARVGEVGAIELDGDTRHRRSV